MFKSGKPNIVLQAGSSEYCEFSSGPVRVPNRTKIKNKCCKILTVLLVVAAAINVAGLVWYSYLNASEEGNVLRSSEGEEHCHVSAERRFDCFPRGEPDRAACAERGCCWDEVVVGEGGPPVCYYSMPHHSYRFDNVTETGSGITAYMSLVLASPYPGDVQTLRLDVSYDTETRLHIKIWDPSVVRYEPPYPKLMDREGGGLLLPEDRLLYKVAIDKEKLGFQVVRRNSGTVIFDSQEVGGFIYSDQLLQLSALVPTRYIYGLGHQRNRFLLDTDWRTITLFNHDLPPTDYKQKNKNLYSSHPFYLSMERDGSSNGVLLFNSNAMDVVLQPAPAITYRTVGGVMDFYLFLGPSPTEVVAQYTALIGRPYMPPYWSLGFHLSRLGYTSVENTREILDHNRIVGIPLDTQWNDLDYMKDRNDFTVADPFAKLQSFVEYLHYEGLHFVMIVDPGVSAGEPEGSYPPYDDGLAKGVFIMDENGTQPFKCRVWNRSNKTVFVDFTHPNSNEYWYQQLSDQYRHQFNFDGIWLDMNEPTNFIDGSFKGCPDNSLEHPPYCPAVDGGFLYYKTVCMSARHHAGLHYDLHNIHGLTQTIATNQALRGIREGKRPFVISRATFPGVGRYSGTWTGDVYSTWDDMRHSIADVLSFSLFGIPQVGADICGFNGNTTVELCQRWSQLGAFYPFSRNHNSDENIAQDPYSLGREVVGSARKALLVRYTLLPYLYTLFWRASREGTTVARPLLFEFPEDVKTYSESLKFLWGPALLIIPILSENERSVITYLPKGLWYNYYSKECIRSSGANFVLTEQVDTIPLLVRGGHIIPTQQPATTTTISMRNKMGLLVLADEQQTASGTLYWDDGDSIDSFESGEYNWLEFRLRGDRLESVVENWGFEEQPTLGSVTLVGLADDVQSVQINHTKQDDFSYDLNTQTLTLENLSLSLKEPFVISWVYH